MASEAERADVVVGDGELLHGEGAADGEGDAAEAVEGVEGGDGAGVVAGPEGVRDGVEREGGGGLGGDDGHCWPIHGRSGAKCYHVTHLHSLCTLPWLV